MGGKQIVIASGNRGKLREFAELFSGYPIDIIPQSRFSVPEVEETGSSFAENALLKARNAASVSGYPVIADDSGIEVDVLNGEPGIYSARYAGESASDEENLQLLLKNIARTGAEKPTARFQCVIVYIRSENDPEPLIAQGAWQGYAVNEPRGDNGFGYDPIFYVPTQGCTSAELPADVKNTLSHRGRALIKLLELMKEANEFV